MKKRYFTAFVAAVVFIGTTAGFTAVHATGGLPDISVNGPVKETGGLITWSAYPGTDYYIVSIDSLTVEKPFNVSAYKSKEDLSADMDDLLALYGAYAGAYKATVTAYDKQRNAIAEGISGNYPYYTYGQCSKPSNPHWEGYSAKWSSPADADKYRFELYKNGELIEVFNGTGSSENLYNFVRDYDSEYKFRVCAYNYKNKYEASDYTEFSGVQNGYVKRTSGDNRYQTGYKVANDIRKIVTGNMIQKLKSVVIASGENFPDALGGAYLSNMKTAPIILISENTANQAASFIKLLITKDGGRIYVLGGESAVKESWLEPLKEAGYTNIIRYSGEDRYETNLDLLNAVGIPDKTLLVCTGKNFADSLSASAVDYPLLLVGDSLTESQKEYLNKQGKLKFVILGGTSAVSSAVENELKQYGTIQKRLAGENRYDTSLKIAEYFFTSTNRIVLATGKNFPDGLTGGLLAHKLSAPMILASTKYEDNDKIYSYLTANGIKDKVGLQAYVLGGESAVSEGTIGEIFTDIPADYSTGY